MKITRLRTTLVDIPFEPPIGLGTGRIGSASCVLVFLESDQGAIGEGLVFTLNKQRLAVLDAAVRSLEPLAVGLDPGLSGGFSMRATADLRWLGLTGIAGAALSGVEQALLDLRAKLAGVNVARLLGACRSTLPVYHSSDLWVSESIDALQRTAESHLARGFRAMKMRVLGDPKTDIPRMRAIREVIGPEVRLMADLNQRLDVPGAIRFGRMVEEFNLAWLEEPVSAEDHEGEAAVAAALDTPIAVGESVFTSRGVLDLLRHGSADIVMPDIQRMGGPGEFLKAAALAEAHHRPISSHLYSEMSIGLMAAIPNISFLEYMPWTSPVYREQIELDAQGNAVLPDRPGWGFSFDPEIIRRHSLG